MNVPKKSILTVLALVLVASALAACTKGNTPGENLDKALDNAGDAVKDAGEAIKPGK